VARIIEAVSPTSAPSGTNGTLGRKEAKVHA
jgi:hypothetical protein